MIKDLWGSLIIVHLTVYLFNNLSAERQNLAKMFFFFFFFLGGGGVILVTRF